MAAESPLDAPCPECGASAGEPCVIKQVRPPLACAADRAAKMTFMPNCGHWARAGAGVHAREVSPARAPIRLAFAGASGTGKTTLATWASETFSLPMNPVGARSVARAMGFASPYAVDAAGKRAEFQKRLVTEKCAWEMAHESFVTDRTTLDNLTYTIFHDVGAVDAPLYEAVLEGMKRYTHVVFCPVDAFCDVSRDASRVADPMYHRLYDRVLMGLLDQEAPCPVFIAFPSDLDSRQSWIGKILPCPHEDVISSPSGGHSKCAKCGARFVLSPVRGRVDPECPHLRIQRGAGEYESWHYCLGEKCGARFVQASPCEIASKHRTR